MRGSPSAEGPSRVSLRSIRATLASQFAGAAGAEFGERLVGEPVELAAFGVALDLAVEAVSFERLEPCAELRKLVGSKFCDGFLDVFDGHGRRISQRKRRQNIDSMAAFVDPSYLSHLPL